MPKPNRINLSAKIRETLENEITSGKLHAGSRIDEQELMERFGVSRTPAREAVLQLLSLGLVNNVPRQGVVVAQLSLAEYIAMLEVLMALEGLAARLSARRMPAVQRKQLVEANEACKRAADADDPQAYGEANRIFHEIIYDSSLNEVLARQLRAMRLRMRHPRRALFDRPNRMANSHVEHQTLLEAILAGDEDAAFDTMTHHIFSGGNLYADAIASMPPAQTEAEPVEPARPVPSLAPVKAPRKRSTPSTPSGAKRAGARPAVRRAGGPA